MLLVAALQSLPVFHFCIVVLESLRVMLLGIEMDFVERPARLFRCLEVCLVVAGGGMDLAFF